MEKPEFLYHGSTTAGIKILEPRKRYTPDGEIDFPAIYATPFPAYAAAHAFPWGSNEGFELDVVDGVVELKAPLTFAGRLQVPIYIYKVSSKDFEHTEEEIVGYTWHATKPVAVIGVQKFENVEIAIASLGGRLEYF